MGKFVFFLIMLICIDLIFLVSGLFSIDTPTSIIFNAIIDPGGIKSSNFWVTVVGVLGIAGLAAAGSIKAGFITAPLQVTLFAVMATTLALLAVDFINIFRILYSLSPILGTLIMSPIIVIFLFTVGEWLRGKD